NRRSFPQLFTTTPFEHSSTGRFEAYSCKSTSEGLLPSLVQHHELALVFVTHPTRRAWTPSQRQGVGRFPTCYHLIPTRRIWVVRIRQCFSNAALGAMAAD